MPVAFSVSVAESRSNHTGLWRDASGMTPLQAIDQACPYEGLRQHFDTSRSETKNRRRFDHREL